LNFKKFHKAEFHLKCDETTTIGFITWSFFYKQFSLKENQNLRTSDSKEKGQQLENDCLGH